MKRVYLLPNLLTTANFFCGLLGLTFAMKGAFLYAAAACVVAMLFDFVDGQVARTRGASSRFGIEYDSLADMLSFGILPTAMGYMMVLHRLGRIGLGIAFLYAVSCALRLARYNAQAHEEEQSSFVGLPTPAAAGLICSVIVFAGRYELSFPVTLLPFLMLALAYLMVSTLPYPSFKRASVRQKKPFLNLVGIVVTASIIVSYPEICFLLLFTAYGSVGILAHFRFRRCARLVRAGLMSTPFPAENEKD